MAKQIVTISQALRRVKEIKGEIALLDKRMRDSVCWTEPGNKPVYDYGTLAAERVERVQELVRLKARLIKTNATTNITLAGQPTMSIQEVVFVLAEMKARKELLVALPIAEGTKREHTGEFNEKGQYIYEIKTYHTALGLLDRDKQVAALSKDIAEINEAIEDANHRTNLVE